MGRILELQNPVEMHEIELVEGYIEFLPETHAHVSTILSRWHAS